MEKVMIIGNSIEGFYNFRRELATELKANDHDLVLVFPKGKASGYFSEQGCKMIPLQMERHGTNPLQELMLLRELNRIIKREKPDVVLTYTIKPNIYAGLICRINKIPYITNITGLGTALIGSGWKQTLLKSFYRFGIGGAACVFFQNRTNMQTLTETGEFRKTRLLPGSGVNLEQHCFEKYPDETDNMIFLTIGRIMRDKGTDELLAAARAVKQLHPNVQFKLIGRYDGNYHEKVEEAVQEGVVEYLGEQSDVHRFIKNSHAIVHASYHEGMSNVLLESAAAGRPVIATDVPGCRETYDAGISGVSCRARDAKDLERAICEFIELPYEQKVEMGKKGRMKVECEFDRKDVIRAYLEEIERSLGAKNYVAV